MVATNTVNSATALKDFSFFFGMRYSAGDCSGRQCHGQYYVLYARSGNAEKCTVGFSHFAGRWFGDKVLATAITRTPKEKATD